MDIVGSVHEGDGILCDDKLLIRRNDEDLYRGIVSGDLELAVSALAYTVLLNVQLHSKGFHVADCTLADGWTHLSNAGCEHNGIDPTEQCCVCTNVFLDSVAFHGHCKLGLLVSFVCSLLYVTSVCVAADSN